MDGAGGVVSKGSAGYRAPGQENVVFHRTQRFGEHRVGCRDGELRVHTPRDRAQVVMASWSANDTTCCVLTRTKQTR